MESKIHTYESDEITVTYDIKRCIHAAECVRGLPMVFKPELRRWIQPENSTGERIADLEKMPPVEEAHHGKLLIKLMKNGPAILEGYYTLESAEGSQQPSNKGVALCRCGGSSQKPFCDGTHRKIDFKD